MPVVALLLAAFAQPEYEKDDLYKGIEITKNVKLTCAVLDPNGDPIPGATAIIKGKNSGATTDANGVFTIELSTNDIVIIQFMGFEDQVISNGKAGGKKWEIRHIQG